MVELKVNPKHKPSDHNFWLIIHNRHRYSWKKLEMPPMVHKEKLNINFLTHLLLHNYAANRLL